MNDKDSTNLDMSSIPGLHTLPVEVLRKAQLQVAGRVRGRHKIKQQLQMLGIDDIESLSELS